MNHEFVHEEWDLNRSYTLLIGILLLGSFNLMVGSIIPMSKGWVDPPTIYQEWIRFWGGDDTETARALVLDITHNIYVAGEVQFSSGKSDGILVK